MSEHGIHVVIAERLVEYQRLHVVGAGGRGVALGELAVYAHLRTLVAVLVVGIVVDTVDDGAGGIKLQPVGEDHVGEDRGVDLVEAGLHVVVAVVAERVTCREERTGDTIARGQTIVVSLVSVLVFLDVDVAVFIHLTDIDRIDRCDGRGEVHQVGRVGRRAQVGVRLHQRVHILCVHTQFQPLLGLIVGLDTARDTLIAASVDDTVLVEIAQRHVERRAVGHTLGADIVLLAQCVLVGGIVPVIGSHVIFLAVALIGATECGSGVQFAVGADEQLAFWHSVAVVGQLLEHGAVGFGVGVGSRHAVSIEVLVVELAVVSLVVLAGILDDIILLDGAGVGIPLHVYRNLGLASTAFLGGDDDHTGGTTGTIEGRRSSIFQDRYRLDIVSRNRRQVAGVGGTVYDDQRVGAGVHRGNTTDVDAAARRARLS